LAETTKMKDYDFSVISTELPPNVPPEYLLWLAVIDRAVVDYIRWYTELNIKQKNSLEWFLFEPRPCPNNLQFICDLLFDDHEAADTIRKRVRFLTSHATEDDMNIYNQTRYRRVKNRLT
jgi:hypothetical protein